MPARRTKKRRLKPRRSLMVICILVLLFLLYCLLELPSPTKLKSNSYPQSSQIFDRHQKLLYQFYSDRSCIPVKLSEVPQNLKLATLAIEDTSFYQHSGFDFRGILRGLYQTLVHHRLEGGSTITQQLVKNGLLTPKRTVSRKIKEAILTVFTEVIYSKDQILEMYFNQTPYGSTIWGVKAAALGIFNKDLADLSLAESALLAGLPASPTSYWPISHPQAAKARQKLVLNRLEELGWISHEAGLQAQAEPLIYSQSKDTLLAPHFVFYVKEQLVRLYGSSLVNEGGLKITTTLDLELQHLAQATVAAEVAKLKKLKVSNGAALITNPKTGEILSMVGSKDFFDSAIDGQFNVTTAPRQPGSAIKPLNYATAIEMGKITPASVIFDAPVCFIAQPKLYCPSNYGNRYFGLQTVRSALGNSLNIPAVKVLNMYGVSAFVASASAMGITSFKNSSDYGLSLTLGGGEVTMTELSVDFGTLANMGTRQNLVSVLSVIDRQDKTLTKFNYIPGPRVLSRETAFIIQQILADDGARLAVFGFGSLLKIKGHPEVAAKTGTTNDMKDNCTIGYTPDYVVSVWVGNNNNSKMSGLVSGISGAAHLAYSNDPSSNRQTCQRICQTRRCDWP